MTSSSRHRFRLHSSALLALFLLAMGAATHFAHHILDPECIDEGRSPEHPCACSVLHSAALAEADVHAVPSARATHTVLHVQETIGPAAAIPARCAPRAPPLG